MKVMLIGCESKIREHLPYWETVPNLQLAIKIIESQEDVNALSSFDNEEIVDLCVAQKYRQEILNKINEKTPAFLIGADNTNLVTLKDEVVYTKKQMIVHLLNPFIGAPEMVNLSRQFKDHKLGKAGVHRISLKSEGNVTEHNTFTNEEINLIHWIVATLGDYKTIFAKQIRDRYITVHIRHLDGSFTHLELARGFGVDELNIELTGSKGMLTHKSQDNIPIRINKADHTSNTVSPIGKPLAQRQLKEAFHTYLNNKDTFCNISEIEQVEQLIHAIELSIKHRAPISKGGMKND